MFELADCFYEEWRELHELGAAGYEGRYELTISCDRFHKDGVSGGESYGIPVPHPGADAPLLWEWHNTTFVDYLRICFEWGGFPGLARRQDSVPRELLALSEGLLPI